MTNKLTIDRLLRIRKRNQDAVDELRRYQVANPESTEPGLIVQIIDDLLESRAILNEYKDVISDHRDAKYDDRD